MSKAKQAYALRLALGRRADEWRAYMAKVARRLDGLREHALHSYECPGMVSEKACGPGCTRWELQQLSNEVFQRAQPGKRGPKPRSDQ